MHNNQSSSLSTDTLSGKRSRSCSRSPSHSCSCSCSCKSSSSRSYTNHHVSHDDHKSSGPLKRNYLYSSEGNNNRQAHCPDKSNTVFAIFAAPKAKKSKHTPKWEIAPAEQNPCVPPCIFVPDRELDCLTDSHVKLNILDDIQELLNNSHNKRAFNYDEDTTSLVEEPTLATLELSLSINSSSFTGNTPIASEYHCYEIEADTPSLNYHGPKIMFLKQELPVTICTADTIGTIQSQRLFKYSLTQAQMSL